MHAEQIAVDHSARAVALHTASHEVARAVVDEHRLRDDVVDRQVTSAQAIDAAKAVSQVDRSAGCGRDGAVGPSRKVGVVRCGHALWIRIASSYVNCLHC